jgi:hypothetical protein
VTSKVPAIESAPSVPEPPRTSAPRKPEIQPTSADRYGVHFTASSSLRDKIEQARALASHRVDSADLAALVELAFDAFIRDLLKERFAVGRKPRAAKDPLSPGAQDLSHLDFVLE